MDPILAILLVLAAVIGFLVLAIYVPFGRWKFEFEGRQYRVINYVTRETIAVDGQVLADTRIGGDGMMWAMHGIQLPGGRTLHVRIGADGGQRMTCLATVDEAVVYTSHGALSAPTATLPERAPQALGGPEVVPLGGQPDDPRWESARVLLTELEQGPSDTARAAHTLKDALRDALLRLDAARASAQAHVALGGSNADVSELMAARESVVVELLALLRELHLAAHSVSPTPRAVPHVEEELQRLAAEREVRAVRLKV